MKLSLPALRGFALCGILLVNIDQITPMERISSTFHWLPIPHSRFLLVRRLTALGLLGAAHQLLQPGEALAPYAVIGLVILLPATWLPTRLVLIAGLVGTVASVTLVSGGIASIPGLFLLGLGVARLGVVHTLDRRTGQLAAVLTLAAPAVAAAVRWQYTYAPAGPFATRIAAGAGLLGALAYATALLLLLHTRLGRSLSAVLEPLGRMALTNYITATLAVTATTPLLGLRGSARWDIAMLLAAGILVVQAFLSRWWLRRMRYGPLEWCLRSVTWWSIVPIARSLTPAA